MSIADPLSHQAVSMEWQVKLLPAAKAAGAVFKKLLQVFYEPGRNNAMMLSLCHSLLRLSRCSAMRDSE